MSDQIDVHLANPPDAPVVGKLVNLLLRELYPEIL